MLNRIIEHRQGTKSLICGILAVAALTIPENVKATTLQTFFNKASFLEAAGTNLTMVDFEFNDKPLPLQKLDSNTSYGAIKPGDIPPGVTFTSSGGNSNDLVLVPPKFAGNASIVTDSLFSAFSNAPIIVKFSQGVTAIGADVFSFNSASTIVITIIDEKGKTSVFNVNPETEFPTYFGVMVKGGTISQIQYDPPSGFTAGIDNFQFGRTVISGVPQETSILNLLNSWYFSYLFNYLPELKVIPRESFPSISSL